MGWELRHRKWFTTARCGKVTGFVPFTAAQAGEERLMVRA
jgi:hypothetical protein